MSTRHLDGITGQMWLRAVVVFAIVTTLVLSSAGTVILLKNSQAAKRDRAIQSASLQLLIECTTPPGQRTPPELHPTKNDCFIRSQTASSAVIAPNGPLSPLLAAAAACGAAHPGDIESTRACVLKGLQ